MGWWTDSKVEGKEQPKLPGMGTTLSPWWRSQARASWGRVQPCFAASFSRRAYISLFFSKFSPLNLGWMDYGRYIGMNLSNMNPMLKQWSMLLPIKRSKNESGSSWEEQDNWRYRILKSLDGEEPIFRLHNFYPWLLTSKLPAGKSSTTALPPKNPRPRGQYATIPMPSSLWVTEKKRFRVHELNFVILSISLPFLVVVQPNSIKPSQVWFGLAMQTSKLDNWPAEWNYFFFDFTGPQRILHL